MRYVMEVRVEPVPVSGYGIPFGQRTMYAVRSYSGIEGTGLMLVGGLASAYWSRNVALRIAAERIAAQKAALIRSVDRLSLVPPVPGFNLTV